MFTNLSWALVKEMLPKIIIGVLAAALVAGVVAYIAKQERKEQRIENTLIESGRTQEVVKQQEGTLRNVEKANNAERAPTLDARERVRSEYDRCTASPASCE